jgi:hypothetical protein
MFDNITHPQKRAFLAAFATCPIVKRAAEAAGISREAHYDWKANDPEYAEAFELARKIGGDALEDEACERAMGYEVPVFDKRTGELVGMAKRHSDRLMLAMLAAAKPEKYGKKLLELSGTVNVALAERLAAGRARLQATGTEASS